MKKELTDIQKKRRLLFSCIFYPILAVLLFITLINLLILPATGKNARNLTKYNAVKNIEKNSYINNAEQKKKPVTFAAHRAGANVQPEETWKAFKDCLEKNKDAVDVLEFDLHLTKDNRLVLMHDHTLDRTSNSKELFGKSKVKIKDKTLAELKQLNMGENFVDKDGKTPYKGLRGDAISDDIKILELEEALDKIAEYDTAKKMQYIIEIKDGGKRGKKSMDILYEIMVKKGILERTIVGTFKGEISKYIDKFYAEKNVIRSAGIKEVLNFYYSFLYNTKPNVKFKVLQIPLGGKNMYSFATKAFIDYAHANGIAVQYWPINKADDAVMLARNGADTIMSDDPKLVQEAVRKIGK